MPNTATTPSASPVHLEGNHIWSCQRVIRLVQTDLKAKFEQGPDGYEDMHVFTP